MARITTAKAQELWSNHNNNSSRSRFPDGEFDANCVWFSLTEMTDFINELRAAGDVSGVRIYFGRYGSSDGPTNKENLRATLFLSATEAGLGTGGGANDADKTSISPLNFGTSGWPPYVVYPKL